MYLYFVYNISSTNIFYAKIYLLISVFLKTIYVFVNAQEHSPIYLIIFQKFHCKTEDEKSFCSLQSYCK